MTTARGRFRRISSSVFLTLLSLALMPAPVAYAKSFTVNLTSDGVDADTLDGHCDIDLVAPGHQCTLRAAIMQANARPGADRINLKSRTYELTIIPIGGPDEEEGDLDVDVSSINNNSLIIRGNGRGTTISAAGVGDRVFEVSGFGGIFVLSKLTITGGSGVAHGGGISNVSAQVGMQNVTITGNTADAGGGIYNENGTMVLNQTTIASNAVTVEGGGIKNIFASSTMTLNNVTLAENSADQGGSAIFATTFSTTNLNNVTITRNSSLTQGAALRISASGIVNVGNSIVADQLSGDDCDFGTVVSLGYNIESAATCGMTATGDQQNVVVLSLEPVLGDYGGITNTVAPRWDSPAIDAGDPAGCFGDLNGDGTLELLTEDQRGIARVDLVSTGNTPPDAVCDIGAAELNNLVVNGTFTEYSPKFAAHWMLDAASVGDSGTVVAHVVADGAPEKMYQEIAAPINGLAGDQYYFEMEMRSLNTTSTYMDAGVEYRDLGGVITHYISLPLNDGTHGLETYAMIVTIPVDYDLLTVVALNTDMSGGLVEIDNVMLLIQ